MVASNTPIADLYEKEETWTQGCMAADRYYEHRKMEGFSQEKGKEFQCFCLAGAVFLCYPPEQRSEVARKLVKQIRLDYGLGCLEVNKRTPQNILIHWNDNVCETAVQAARLARRAGV